MVTPVFRVKSRHRSEQRTLFHILKPEVGENWAHPSNSSVAHEIHKVLQTGDMKRRPGNRIEGATVCTSLGSLLRPLFYFLDDISYLQSVVV